MIINIFSHEFPPPLGHLGFAEADNKLVGVLFNCPPEELPNADLTRICRSCGARRGVDARIYDSALIKKAAKQLSEYLRGDRPEFDIHISVGSNRYFEGRVYVELMKLPVGQTRSYKEIAEACGSPKAYRAVGMANNKNPLPIFIPCHRVIGSNGGLVGYAGGLTLKKYLLDLEKRYYAAV